MISYTVENAFMLAVFKLLISGLILCSSAALLYLQRDSSKRRALRLLTAAFAFYSLNWLLRVAIEQSFDASGLIVLPEAWRFWAQVLETTGLALLGLSLLVDESHFSGRAPLWALMAGVIASLVGGQYVLLEYWPSGLFRISPAPLLSGLWLATVTLVLLQRKEGGSALATASLGVLSVAQFLCAASDGHGNPEWLWSLQNAVLLLGLALFALVVENLTSYLPLRFFVRLNLIFIVTASMLILTVAELERWAYLRISERHSQDLTEFLRGHVIYYSHQGADPQEILSSPSIIRKVTADFGRLSDLRAVRVMVQGWTMEMSIGEDWTISHSISQETRQRSDPPTSRGLITTLTPVPIVNGGAVLGRIELDESLGSINAQVARHMRIIFFTFTGAVFVAAGLFGVTVRRAHKTIQRQFAELEQTHQQLAHSDRLALAGQLAGGAAHEINNPAGIIVATSDYLLSEARKQSLSELFQEDLQAIGRQARRISDIVVGLLAFSRPATLNRQLADVNAILRESLALLAARCREQRIQIEDKLEPLPSTSADAEALEQVFVNILKNATDAIAEGGQIRVETEVQPAQGDNQIVVLVADSGTGIAEENLQRIFDPFFSTKAKGRGSGLGLSVSHGIIKEHGGRIEVESRLGEGTTFRVYLPIREGSLEET